MQVATEALTEAIYDAALDPAHWPAVLAHLKSAFRTEAETFYVLDFHTRQVGEAHLAGVAPEWLARFNHFYFAADNPWNVHSTSLHRLGMVRTNERLDRFTRQGGALFRSSYYNEWMRPQGFHHSIGNTLTSDRQAIANVTLLRAPDLPRFNRQEVRLFEQLSVHFVRALRVRQHLERVQTQRDGLAQALDHVDDALLLLDERGRLLHGNRAALERLARRDGLQSRHGLVEPTQMAQRARFHAWLAAHAADSTAAASVPDTLLLGRDVSHLPLALRASGWTLPLSSGHSARRGVLISMSPPAAQRTASNVAALRGLYQLTPAEARLTQALCDGLNLREAAEALDITYGTARTRLKAVFGKTGTHRQAALIAQVHRDLPPPHAPH
jgi:DNA-binding CsgD family transcriptional regulator/PAS domain-containing protein